MRAMVHERLAARALLVTLVHIGLNGNFQIDDQASQVWPIGLQLGAGEQL